MNVGITKSARVFIAHKSSTEGANSYYCLEVKPEVTIHKQLLPFGRKQSISFRHAEHMSEELGSRGRLSLSYRPANAEEPFFSKFSVIKTDSLRMVANVSSPVEVDAEPTFAIGAIFVPFYGTTKTIYGTRSILWGDTVGPIYLPPFRCQALSTRRSVVSIDVDPIVIEETASTMFPHLSAAQSLYFDYLSPRILGTRPKNGPDFVRLLKNHILSLDAVDCDPEAISLSGLDDAIIRVTILLLNPDLLGPVERINPSRSSLELACDYITENLAGRITLTDLERVTGLSARSLQYAFKQKFDRTPVQWITDKRLEAVRAEILAFKTERSISQMASPFFSNLGDFARLYWLRFGELPSQTVRRTRS